MAASSLVADPDVFHVMRTPLAPVLAISEKYGVPSWLLL